MAHRQLQPPWPAGHYPRAEELVTAPPGQREEKEDMDVFLMNSRKRTTVFLDPEKNMSVRELKMIVGISNLGTENQMLYKDEECVEDNNVHVKYELNSSTAKAHASATAKLGFQDAHSRMLETL